MAIPLEQAGTPQQPEAVGDVSGKDIELAFRMGVKLMTEGDGINIIKQSIEESKDPAMVIGQFLAQIMMALVQQLGEQINIDPRAFLAKGGWLELMLDFIEGKLGYPPEFSDEVFGQVVEVIKASAQSPQGGAPQQAAPVPVAGGT